METVKQWAFSTCITYVIASVVRMISPNSFDKKIIKLLISGFLILGILTSFVKIKDINKLDLNLNIKNSSNVKIDNKTLKIMKESVINSLYPIYKEKLEKLKIYEFGMDVKIDVTNNGSKLEYVNIFVDNLHKYSSEDIEKKFTDELGIKTIVKVSNLEGIY